MNHYYIGKQCQYIEVQYSRSDRSQCRQCKQKISKQDIRVSISLDEDHFQGKKWYHLDCFQLKPRHASFDPEKQIYNLDKLDQEDQQKVMLYFKVLLGRFGKKDAKVTKSKSEEKQAKKSKDKKAKSVPKKKKNNRKDSSEDDIQLKDLQLSSSQQSEKPKKKKIPSKKVVKTQPADKPKREKQQKKSEKKEKKRIKKAKKPTGGYTQQQQQKYHQYCEYYQKMTTEQLKNILSLNGQTKTGSKGELISKCADGKLLGGIPRCQACGGGKLRYNHTNGIYTCPGYMQDEDFVHCSMTFTEDQVKRSKWQQL